MNIERNDEFKLYNWMEEEDGASKLGTLKRTSFHDCEVWKMNLLSHAVTPMQYLKTGDMYAMHIETHLNVRTAEVVACMIWPTRVLRKLIVPADAAKQKSVACSEPEKVGLSVNTSRQGECGTRHNDACNTYLQP